MNTAPASSVPAASSAPGASGALEARSVSVLTAGGKTLLRAASVCLEPGRFLAVIGPNGAGKTTLLRTLAGEAVPASGQVRLGGCPLDHWPARQRACRLSVMPQNFSLNAALTGLEVVLLGRSPHPAGGDGVDDLAAAHEALSMMDAAHLAARFYPSLSGGEKSRVQAARAVAQIWEAPWVGSSARFLLLDEPTASLDCAHQHHLLERARHLARSRSVGVLAVLHDLNLAACYADEILVLKDGQTLAAGPTADVFREDILSRAFDMGLMIVPHPLHGWPVALAR